MIDEAIEIIKEHENGDEDDAEVACVFKDGYLWLDQLKEIKERREYERLKKKYGN